MPTIPIKDIGLGRMTRSNPSKIPLGAARDSLNFLHNVDSTTCTKRAAIDRVNATAPAASPVLAIHEYVNAAGTATLLAKVGSALYTWSLTPATAMTSILTGLDSTHLPGHCTAGGFFFLADFAVGNYISDGTSAHSHVLQKTGPQGTVTLGHRVGTAVGNTAATISYYITDLEPTTGEETPPSSAVTIARLADEGVALSVMTYTGSFTSKRIYRNKAGGTQPYLVTTLTGSTVSYNDDSLDSALSTVSTVHDSAGSAAIEKPEAAKFCCFFKGRLFLANLSGAPSRIRWSKVLEPTQFSNATTARFDVGKNDGGEITGIVPFRGSLVIFKTNSIWVMNGDQDETTFSVFEAVPGKGCVAPWTIRRDGDDRIYFLSAHGVLTFDLANVPAIPLSDPITDDFHNLEFLTYANFFVAGIDPRQRTYEIAVVPSDATTNTKVHVINLDTGAWGRKQFAMGQVVPSCYSDTGVNGPVRNGDGRIKLYVGDLVGYIYETDATTNADGVTSGTTEATITSVADTTHTTCSAAAFRTTGDTLKGLSLTLRRAADNSYETVAITSNTATALVHGAWVGTAAIAGDTVFIGAIQATLSLNRMDLETAHRKRWHRIEVEFEKQTATTPLRIGYTLDGDAVPTATSEVAMSNNYFARKRIDRRAVGLSLYFDIIGTAYSCDLLRLTVDVDVFVVRRPTS